MEDAEREQGSPNEAMLPMQDSALFEAACDEQVRLGRKLEGLRDLLRSNPAVQNDAIESLQSAEQAAQQVTSRIEQCIRALPIALRPSPRSAAVAMKVFGLPEIAERILLNLDPTDLLRTQQVSTTMLSTIDQSPNLQRKLLLKPDPDAFFTPFDSFLARPFSINIRFRRGDATSGGCKPACIVYIQFPRSPRSLKYLPGSRIWRTLVCQPPVFELEARIMCRCSNGATAAQQPSITAQGREKLTSKSGFTIQELWDTAQSIRRRHQLCPHAEPEHHDHEGFVNCAVRFEAPLELQDKDPRRIARQAWWAKQSQHRVEDEQRDARLGAYIAAKLAALNSGQPIPTLAEFETNPARPT